MKHINLKNPNNKPVMKNKQLKCGSGKLFIRTSQLKTLRRRIFALSVLLPLLLSLCGCAAFEAPLEGMLSPPKLTKTQTEIYNALTLNIGDTSELIYPKSGEFRSPFVLYNMDDEPTDEAVVFYREKSPDEGTVSGLRMNLLDQKEGQWVSVADKALSGSDIERVSFYDFGDGINMMVCSSFVGQSENALTVLTYSPYGSFNELYKTTYSFMDIYDIDDDGFDELFLVNYDSALNNHIAYLVGQKQDQDNNSSFGLLSSTALASDAVSIQRLTRQKLKSKQFLLFLDYSKGDNIYGTQLLSCYSNNIILIRSEDYSRRYNSNIPILYSSDIDGDGRVEIPVTLPMLGYELLTVPEQMLEVDWIVVNEENFYSSSTKYQTYVSVGYEYIFYIPVRWHGFVTVQKSENNVVNFVHYDGNGFSDVLLSVRVSEQSPAEEGWEHFGDENSNVYVKNADENDPMAITKDELNSCLYVIPKKE